MNAAPALGMVALLLSTSFVRAQETGRDSVAAALEYVREVGAESCPDEAELKASVQRQLGSAVFEREPATRVASVLVTRARGRFVARLALRSVTGQAQGAREIESISGSCDELSEALSLALALALDPGPMAYTSTEPAPQADPEPPTPPPPESTATTETSPPVVVIEAVGDPTTPSTPTNQPRWEVGLGAGLNSGLLPQPALAVTADLSLRWPRLGLLLEATGVPGVSSTHDGTRLETQAALARVGACGFLSEDAALDLGVCGLGTLGVLRADGPTFTDRSLTVLAAVGGRIVGSARVLGPIRLELRADLHTNLARTELSLAGQALWRSPLLFGEVSFMVVVHFL